MKKNSFWTENRINILPRSNEIRERETLGVTTTFLGPYLCESKPRIANTKRNNLALRKYRPLIAIIEVWTLELRKRDRGGRKSKRKGMHHILWRNDFFFCFKIQTLGKKISNWILKRVATLINFEREIKKP